MRLHELTVTAFGPFAETVHVDFDELNDAGLFLLTGATGAGKSSLLDAVCFALYGTVPGARGVKTLKSQHSPADAKPEVRLDLTVQDRRFVVRRTPEWTRPKRRGTGLITEKASASIMETTGGQECFLSSRAAEVGLLVGSLMGMSAGQFVQVALLPQGEFQTFLRASSQERHDVLQQLFRTDRFARIETWVTDHSRRLVDQADTGRSTVQRLVDTVADRAGLTTPDDLSGDSLTTAAAEDRVLPWVAEVLRQSVTDAELARLRHEEARAAARDARRRHDEAARAAERRRRRDTALAALAELEASEPAASAAREAVAAHHRARGCRPLLDLLDRARSAHEQASHAQARALTSLDSRRPTSSPPHSTAPDPTGALDPGVPLAALIEQVRSRIARLEALLPREQLAAAARRERDADQARLHAAERDLSEVELRTDTVPVEIESRVVALADAAARAAPQATVRSLLETARDRHSAAVQLAEVNPALRTLDDQRRAARDRMQDARQQQLAVLARRLAGMAAELAGELEHGAACQVCGSTEHPRRAEPSADAVTEHDQRRAERDLAVANAALDTADEMFLELRRRHDGLVVASAGLGVEEAADQVAVLETAAAEAEAARLEQSRLEGELRELRDEQAVLGRRQAAAAASVAALRESVLGHDRTLDAVAVEIAHALGDAAGAPPSESLTAAVARLTAWCEVLVEAQHATAQLEAAETRLADATGQALAAATGQGFASLADLEAAQLADGPLRQLEDRLRRRADEESRVRAVLDDPEIAGMVVDPVDDLAPLVDATDAAAAEASRMLALHDDRAAALGGLLDRLETAMRAWAPLRDESLRAASISRLVRGMGHDNELQMRLSAYVLATRLDQVVAAANERLGHMRDQRYLLQRTGRAERRSAQAGLGLEIVDQWTGDVRAPATLSGGETFVVSLSLALGLADVVTHESGGTEIETLFVDEGFGTLDADTLDDVMDRLDGLRAGGRTVGVVSHVTELRSRIPTQVHVDKGRAGSTVTVHTLVG